MGWTSGRSLPVETLIEYSPTPRASRQRKSDQNISFDLPFVPCKKNHFY